MGDRTNVLVTVPVTSFIVPWQSFMLILTVPPLILSKFSAKLTVFASPLSPLFLMFSEVLVLMVRFVRLVRRHAMP